MSQLTIQPDNQIQATTPDQLLKLAVDKDLDIDKLGKLMELQKQWKDGLAREAFFNALNEFQSVVPDIAKRNTASFETSKGKASYRYADLASIDRAIKPYLKEFGLTKRWEFKDEGETIIVTCIVTHNEGHSERTTMSAKADATGSKNAIQARGSAIEYLKRYTLIGALGLTTTDTDNDGDIPEIDIDVLHRQFMIHYDELMKYEPKKASAWNPDNWKVERTAKNYLKAIGAIRKHLGEIIPKEA